VAGLEVCKRQCFLLPLGARSTGTLQVSATSGYARNVVSNAIFSVQFNNMKKKQKQPLLSANILTDKMIKTDRNRKENVWCENENLVFSPPCFSLKVKAVAHLAHLKAAQANPQPKLSKEQNFPLPPV
jgi:hypothetical protein